MLLFQDCMFALLWHLGYPYFCCSDAQRPSRSSPPALRAGWIQGDSPWPELVGVDKAEIIQVRQPSVHCKYTHYSQGMSTAFFTRVSRHECTARCVSDYHYILQSLISPLLLFGLGQHQLQQDRCENKLLETEIPIGETCFLLPNRESYCPLLPCALCAASLGEGWGMVCLDSVGRLSCNSETLEFFSVFIICHSLRHVWVGKENREVGKKKQENNWKFSNMFQSQSGAIWTLYTRLRGGFYGM